MPNSLRQGSSGEARSRGVKNRSGGNSSDTVRPSPARWRKKPLTSGSSSISDRTIWIDGEFQPWADATVHVLSHSLPRGSLVFDYMSVHELTGNEEAGLPRGDLADLSGGEADYNAAAIRDLLSGTKSTYRDTVLLTVASALVVAGEADDLKTGVSVAADAVDSGKASDVLDKLVEVSNS